MDTRKANTVVQALTSAINELKRARKEIGDIKPEDEYMWLELSYMLVNTYRNLSGFIKARLEGEQTKMFD